MSGDRVVTRHLGMRFPLRGRELVALEDVNLRMADQEFCCIVGPSGCGKTTFLRILAGLERQTAGGAGWGEDPAALAAPTPTT